LWISKLFVFIFMTASPKDESPKTCIKHKPPISTEIKCFFFFGKSGDTSKTDTLETDTQLELGVYKKTYREREKLIIEKKRNETENRTK